MTVDKTFYMNTYLMTGDQKWMVYVLERFLAITETTTDTYTGGGITLRLISDLNIDRAGSFCLISHSWERRLAA